MEGAQAELREESEEREERKERKERKRGSYYICIHEIICHNKRIRKRRQKEVLSTWCESDETREDVKERENDDEVVQ